MPINTMIQSSACQYWQTDRSQNAAQEHRSYTTTGDTTYPPLSAPLAKAADVDKLIALNSGMLPRARTDRCKANYDALLRELKYDTKSGAGMSATEVAAAVGADTHTGCPDRRLGTSCDSQQITLMLPLMHSPSIFV